MKTYDPEKVPDTAEWLDLEEDERISRVSDYHRHAKIKLPNLTIHATLHAVVENQIAEEMQAVRETVARLQEEGLSRHAPSMRSPRCWWGACRTCCGRAHRHSSRSRPTSRICGRSPRKGG